MSAPVTGDAPFDVLAARAAAREADGRTFPFDAGDEHFELMPMRRWKLDAQELLSEGKFSEAMPMVLIGGMADWQRLRAAGDGIELGDIQRIMDRASVWNGLGSLGNSALPPQPASTPT
jgi:hypothetical protein